MSAQKIPLTQNLLSRAFSPETAQTLQTERIKPRPLLLQPQSIPSASDTYPNARTLRQQARALKAKTRRKSKKPRPLSAKEKRKFGVHDLPRAEQKYSIYEGLHKLWLDYMREILGDSRPGPACQAPGVQHVGGQHGRGLHGLGSGRSFVDATGAGQILVSADYHGALLEVVRCSCPSRVGLKGIVVRDTKFTFEIVTRGDGVRVVPKEGTVFRFEVPFSEVVGDANDGENLDEGKEGEGRGERVRERKKPLVFEIHGNRFQTRAADRANKKVRLHLDPHL